MHTEETSRGDLRRRGIEERRRADAQRRHTERDTGETEVKHSRETQRRDTHTQRMHTAEACRGADRGGPQRRRTEEIHRGDAEVTRSGGTLSVYTQKRNIKEAYGGDAEEKRTEDKQR